MEYVLEEGERAGIDGLDLANFRQAVEVAIQANIEELAQAAEEFAETNDARIQQLFQPGTSLEGFRMEPLQQEQTLPSISDLSVSPNNFFTYLLQALVLAGLVFLVVSTSLSP